MAMSENGDKNIRRLWRCRKTATKLFSDYGDVGKWRQNFVADFGDVSEPRLKFATATFFILREPPTLVTAIVFPSERSLTTATATLKRRRLRQPRHFS